MPDAGETIGGYVIDREVGRGGHATVYQAHKQDQLVALKALTRRTPAAQARLDREFRLAHRLCHPHIVTMYEHGEFWLAMQFVDGGKSTQLQSQPEKLKALAQIAGALDYLHANGIVHADVKPANILVSQAFSKNGAHLIDFSVAHAVVDRPKDHHASLQYAAPEILSAHAPTAATDEYALACSAVELLTGAPPFAVETSRELIDKHLRGIPPRISLRAFDTVIAKAMARDPEVRYQSCTEFVEHLTRSLS